MDLEYQSNGYIIPGIYVMEVNKFSEIFGYTNHRKLLIEGLIKGVNQLRSCGCSKIYVDGSFISKKSIPGDFDACWDPQGVDLVKLKTEFPLFFDFANKRENQKNYYKGEFFPSTISAVKNPPLTYIDFFQQDKEGNPKGIIQLV